MKRRQFIKFSATTSVAYILSKITYAKSSSSLLFNLPGEVWVLTDNKWHKLTHYNEKFIYRDIEIFFRNNKNALEVHIQSPSSALSAVRLKWQYDLPAKAHYLGDHWERSYGDLEWKTITADVKNPWYILINDKESTAGFAVKTGAGAICWWSLGDNTLELTMDTLSGGNGVLPGNRTIKAAEIITSRSNPGENPFYFCHRFCGMMCEKPRLPKQPVYGINDWYFAYGNNNYELIRQTTAIMAELISNSENKPFSIIDAGWAAYSPLLPGDGGWNEDFSKPNDKFKDMHRLALDIKKLGMRPGLWMRPLCGHHNEKPNLLAPSIPGRNDPRNPVLDPTIPENLARIKEYFDVYRQWGFEMVKHDFTTFDILGRWGFDMNESITAPGWNFYDRGKTNAEIIRDLYKTIRESAGNDIYIIGCNTISHLSAGIFELCRIGDDTSGRDWSRTRKMGVNALAFRLPQHNKFYAADGDCVGLTTEITWERNKKWLQLLAESGAPLFISAQPQALGTEQKSAIKKAFAQAATLNPLGEPLDWMENIQPVKWKLNNREIIFNWE